MSRWNPQQFARLVAETQRVNWMPADVTMLWVSRDALARAESAGGLLGDSDAEETIRNTLDQLGGDGVVAGIDVRYDGVSIPVTLFISTGGRLPPYLKALHTRLQDATPPRGVVVFAYVKNVVPAVFVADRERLRTLASALLLLADPQQRDDAATTREDREVVIPRRRGNPKRKTTVSVIDVRRRQSSERGTNGERSGVEHGHRWVTRGHWRNQPHGPGRSLRRRIWIEEHICGPEDKPLKKNPKVYKV